MKQLRKRSIWFYLALALILVLFVPLFINWLYKSPIKIIETSWGAEDALAYYGAVLGGMTTLFAVLMTARTARKEYIQNKNVEKNEQKLAGYQASCNYAFGVLDSVLALLLDLNSYSVERLREKLQPFMTEVKRLERFDMVLDKEQKIVVSTKITSLIECSKELFVLLTRIDLLLKKHYDSELFQTLDKLIYLLKQQAVPDMAEIEMYTKRISELSYHDEDKLRAEMQQITKEVMILCNTKFEIVSNDLRQSISDLEHHYEKQYQ